MSTVTVKHICLPPADKSEIRRYIGGADEKTNILIRDIISEYSAIFSEGSICYCRLPVCDCKNGKTDFGVISAQSHNLEKYLYECTEVVLFAATVGLGIDRLIMKYSSLSPATALVLQGIGAERTEALCDCFTDMLKQSEEYKNFTFKPRFSPGYGDLPLDFQQDIFRILNPQKHIGLCLNDSLVMSPTKSVTAIIGIKNKDMEKK